MKSSGLPGRVGEKDKHDKSSSLSATNGPSTRPEPIRGDEGAPIIGPTNPAREAESPGRLAPPETDHGTLPSLKWSFANSHNRLRPGGWARQTTGRELAIAKALNCVNMRLKVGTIRKLHWHKPDEWGFVIKGRVVFDERLTHAAWKSKPSCHVIAAKDRTLSPTMEEASAKEFRWKGLLGTNLSRRYVARARNSR